MKPERWAQIKFIFYEAGKQPADERAAFIRSRCGDDESLAMEIESLLSAHDQAGSFIEGLPNDSAAVSLDVQLLDPMIGRRIGAYEVIRGIGRGGMGAVYLAQDTRLGRQVALKLLLPAIARDKEWLGRFEREARMLASLNHAHIAGLHGLEEAGDVRFLVMELVPGPTLAERLATGPLPQRKALEVCCQIAEALEAAHDKGIIHRDLKPANIKFSEDDQIKVLDFGLAKELESGRSAEDGATLSLTETQAGTILGTPRYMSPEQISAQPLDVRADIWAFGCILYEVLTARPAFDGKTITELYSTVHGREPQWDDLPAETPAAIRLLLGRCLEKDRRSRLRHIGDARIEIEDVLAGRGRAGDVVAQPAGRKWIAAALLGLVLGAAAGAALWRAQSPKPAPPQVTRFALTLPSGQRLVPSLQPNLNLSRDGSLLVYSALMGGRLNHFALAWPLDELAPKPIPGTEGGGGAQMFSPDDKWLCFTHPPSQSLRKVALPGGPPLTVTTWDMMSKGDWGPDDYIYFTYGYPGGIVRAPAAGGDSKPVTQLDTEKQERHHRFAQVLPGGKALLFTVAHGGSETYDDARIVVQSLDTGKRKTVVEGGTYARYLPSGHIVYARSGNLYALPFDLQRLEVTGPSMVVLEGILMSRNSGSAYYSVSDNGTLAYAPGTAEGGERTLVWVDRQGNAKPVPLPPRSYLYARISPDGRQLAVEIEGPNHDFYTYDFERGVLSKMSLDGLSHAPIWSPDAKQIGFRSWIAGSMTMWSMPADRSRPQERLTQFGSRQSAVSWSPDGRYVAFDQMDPKTAGDVWVLPLDKERKPHPVVQSRFVEGSAKFSPDGKWLAYCSNESGRPEVYVQPYPGPGPKIQISTDGGTDPLWRRQPGELYYRSGDRMMVVKVSMGSSFTAGRPQQLWEGHYSHGMSSSCGMPGVSSANYDVAPDGSRFLMIKDASQDVSSTRIIVVLNWTEELKQRFAKQKGS